MLFANFAATMMMTGLVVHQRASMMVDGTAYGTIARFEAQRAAETGLLITILTGPWLLLAAWWLH